MSRFFPAFLVGAAVLVFAGSATAQQAPEDTDACATPDSIVVRGNARVTETTVRGEAGLAAGATLNYRDIQRAIRQLYETGQFSDVRITCATTATPPVTQLVIEVSERPLLLGTDVRGVRAVRERQVREQIQVAAGRPADPALVARSIQLIDSVYQSRGYYLAQIRADTALVEGGLRITFDIDEGSRLAVAGVRVEGNQAVSDGDIVGAMQTRPEGFFWFRRGEFDETRFATDLGERIPNLYGRRGLIDFEIVSDTLIIDPERGKAVVGLSVQEGPRYRVGDFDAAGNRHLSREELRRYYPFGEAGRSIREQVVGLVTRRGVPAEGEVFDQSAWEEATQRLRTAYSNEGYIYAQVRPTIERETTPDGTSLVNLRWDIQEGSPAIINRIDIVGNDYTNEQCIRDALVMLPGDVFNQDRLIRSWQNLGNMGFFEQPAPPETRQANDKGDIDIIFRLKEKRTGNVNFGASLGQGTGAGGFFGIDQPNLFGRCKRVSLQWQFGKYQNDFQLSYTDPAIRRSRVSGTVTGYRSNLKYTIADFGRVLRTGGSVQFGLPIPQSPFTRVFLSYGGETQRHQEGLFERDTGLTAIPRCDNCFRSTAGVTVQHDTRAGLPFPMAGSLQSISARFNGGPLGGTASFQKYTTELRSYTPLFTVGGTRPGSQPMHFVLGLSARGGAIFGSTGPFFGTERFAMGGVQFGEMLRGYDEFSITPLGYLPTTTDRRAQLGSFGDAFVAGTAEFGIRFNQMVYLNAFMDAGNIWDRPREINPTRLFRGAGVGASVVTPLGPLGLDWAYGLDRVDTEGRPAPRWQLHFRLGNINF